MSEQNLTKSLALTAYARHRGVSHVAVLKAIKAGRIQKNSDGTIDVAKADAAWARNTNQAQQRKPAKHSAPQRQQTRNHVDAESGAGGTTPINNGPDFAQSRAVKEAYNARLAKLEYEEKSGALVRVDSVKVAWFNVLRVLRDRMLNLPARLAPMLATETDAKRVRELLDTELRQILNDAADTVTTSS